MSHEIESEFVEEWGNEKSQCQNCTSFSVDETTGECVCTESQTFIPPCGHCNFFQSID